MPRPKRTNPQTTHRKHKRSARHGACTIASRLDHAVNASAGRAPNCVRHCRCCPLIRYTRVVEYLDDNDLNIYTDGSSYSGPRRGDIVGILFVTVDVDGNERTDAYPLPGYAGATNNQAELRGMRPALRAVTKRRPSIDPAPFGA